MLSLRKWIEAQPLPPGDSQGVDSWTGRRGVLRLSIVLGVAILISDYFIPPIVPMGGLYLLPVLLSLWARSARATQVAAGLCAAMACLGSVIGGDTPELAEGLAGLLITLFAIGVTAYLGLMRKGIEKELVARRETMSTTLTSIADGVITTDADGRVSFLNRAASDALSWSAEEAKGRDLAAVFRRLSEKGEPLVGDSPTNAEETSIMLRNGEQLTVEVSSSPIRNPESEGSSAGRVYVFRDISARKAEQARVEELAYRDALTGLANRASFFDRFELELAHTKRRGGVLGLLYLDLDGFKDVNDLHGHDVGDRLLIQLGKRLIECLRAGDTVARLGGDEFTIVLPDVSSKESARGVVEKVLKHLVVPYKIDDMTLHVPPSIGLALYPEDGEDMTTLLRAADNSMYRAKGKGGACWSGTDELTPAPRRESSKRSLGRDKPRNHRS